MLREIDSACARPATYGQKLGVVAVYRLLGFVGIHELEPILMLLRQAITAQNHALPHVLEQLLGYDPIFIPGERRHSQQYHHAVQGQLRHDGGSTAKDFVQPAMPEPIERRGDRRHDVAARLIRHGAEFLSPEVNASLQRWL